MNESRTPVPTEDRLQRSTDDRVIAGVASALAERLGVGAAWVRIAFVVLAFAGGLGVVAYAVGWLLIPEQGRSRSVLERLISDLDGSSAWLGAALIGVAGIVLFHRITGFVAGELLLAAAIFVLGALLYGERLPLGRRRDEPVPPPDGPEPPRPPSVEPDPAGPPGTPAEGLPVAPDDLPPQAASHEGAATAVLAPPEKPRKPEKPVKPAPPPSYLGRLTFAALLGTLAVMAALDNLDVAAPAPRHYAAAALLVTGIGLLVGAVAGRARGLIALGVILVPASMVATVVPVDVFGPYGDRFIAPATTSDLRSPYELSGGRLVLDLRELGDELRSTDGRAEVDAAVGFGALQVYLPDGVGVDLDGNVGIGNVSGPRSETNFDERAGFDVDLSHSADGDGLLVIDLEVGMGVIEILTP